MENVIETTGLVKEYKRVKALSNISLAIKDNVITGIIGRNGAGKTTFLKLAMGYLKKSAGEILTFGKNPYNNLDVATNSIFIDENKAFDNSLNLTEILSFTAKFYPSWNGNLAKNLMNYFSIDGEQKFKNLSNGQKSLFGTITGISAQCKLTIMDEPISGVDSLTRKDLYRLILKDYLENPRSILISSHFVNEIDDLLEDILIIDQGELLYHSSISDLKEFLIEIKGDTKILNKFVGDRKVIKSIEFPNSYSAVILENNFPEADLVKMKTSGFEISSLSAEDTYICITSEKIERSIDNVFNS